MTEPKTPAERLADEEAWAARADAAFEYGEAILAWLNPENQYTDSRRHALDFCERRLLATLDAARAASPSEPTGYWVVDASSINGITQETRDQLSDLLPQAAAAGKQIVVVDGIELRWRSASPSDGLSVAARRFLDGMTVPPGRSWTGDWLASKASVLRFEAALRVALEATGEGSELDYGESRETLTTDEMQHRQTADEIAQFELVERYIRSLQWSADVPETVRSLVAGNLRGFASWLRNG